MSARAPSPRLDPPPPPSPRLAEAVTDELDRAAARAYRLQYQSYRTRLGDGVIGEAPDDPRRQIALDEDEEDSGHASTSRLQRSRLTNCWSGGWSTKRTERAPPKARKVARRARNGRWRRCGCSLLLD